VAIRRVVAPAPQPEPASRLMSATRDVSFLRSDSRCRRYLSDLSNVTPRHLSSEQKGRHNTKLQPVMELGLQFRISVVFLEKWNTLKLSLFPDAL